MIVSSQKLMSKYLTRRLNKILYLFALFNFTKNMRTNQDIKVKKLVFPQSQKKISFIVTPQGAFQSNQSNTIAQQAQTVTLINMFEKQQSQRIKLLKFNSFRIGKEGQIQDMLAPISYNQNGNLQDIQFMEKKFSCRCKMSKCLKLYCECFSKQLFCGPDCSCTCCENNQANQRKLLMLRQQTGNKNSVVEKGCRCVKSNCRKKYCDCFQRGVQCGQHCQCRNCENLGQQKCHSKRQAQYEKEQYSV